MRKKLTAVLPAAAMFAYALAGTTGITQNVYAADEDINSMVLGSYIQRICNEAGRGCIPEGSPEFQA